MKKLALFAGAVAILAPAAFAGPEQKEIKCAVMTDHMVNIKDATGKKMFADYKGRRYFFCCAACPRTFKANSAKFAKNESIPTPKATKPKPKV